MLKNPLLSALYSAATCNVHGNIQHTMSISSVKKFYIPCDTNWHKSKFTSLLFVQIILFISRDRNCQNNQIEISNFYRYPLYNSCVLVNNMNIQTRTEMKSSMYKSYKCKQIHVLFEVVINTINLSRGFKPCRSAACDWKTAGCFHKKSKAILFLSVYVPYCGKKWLLSSTVFYEDSRFSIIR